MVISELAKVVHDNAVDHGWWDEERSPEEILALIHSEWSEALEEARAGRGLVWYACADCEDGPCKADLNTMTACGFKRDGRKPEGIAVELIDGCIRILDYMGHMGTNITEGDRPARIESLYDDANVVRTPDMAPELIAYLHLYTSSSMSGRSFHDLNLPNMFALCDAMAIAMSWVKKQGLDPLAVLLEKHEYNKGRPYKHGKRF